MKGSARLTPVGGVTGHSNWDAFVSSWSGYDVNNFNNGACGNSCLPNNSTWGQLGSDFFSTVSIDDVGSYAYDAVATAGIAACSASATTGSALLAAIKQVNFT